jgi:hypothetical protein
MQRHYCDVEKTWLDFEDECSWCGMTEDEAKKYKNLKGDKLFEEIRHRVNKSDDGHITDD